MDNELHALTGKPKDIKMTLAAAADYCGVTRDWLLRGYVNISPKSPKKLAAFRETENGNWYVWLSDLIIFKKEILKK